MTISLGLGIGVGYRSERYVPTRLFRSGEKGFCLLPGTHYGRMYQERTGAAATTLCSPDDPVGTYHDLITGLYATAPSDTARPTYRSSAGLHWLDFDGSNDTLSVSSIDMSGTGNASVFTAVAKGTDTVTVAAVVGEFATVSPSSNAGAFTLLAPHTTGQPTFGAQVSGTGGVNARFYASNAAPVTRVLTAAMKTTATSSTDALSVRVNGATSAGSQVATASTTGNFGNYPLWFGSRAGSSLFFGGDIYGYIVRGAATSDPVPTEQYLERLSGLSF